MSNYLLCWECHYPMEEVDDGLFICTNWDCDECEVPIDLEDEDEESLWGSN